MRPIVLATTSVIALAACAAPHAGTGDQTLLNVSYDATREFYHAYDSLFAATWKAHTGHPIVVEQSHGGSGAQARAVIEGLHADVVTLAAGSDIDAIAHAGLTDTAWAGRFPHRSAPFTTTIVFLVRSGNPKAIHDWPDLLRRDVSVITANPKTSGGARWAYLAAWGATLARTHGDTAAARAYVTQLYAHVPALDLSARNALTTFVDRGIGDVLLAWETDALLASHTLAPGRVEVVAPSVSIRAEPPVAIVDKTVDARGTRDAATAYLQGLYSPGAQSLAARAFYRPTDAAVAITVAAQFPAIPQFTVDSVFHGWTEAQRTHFADGGVFDQIQAASRPVAAHDASPTPRAQ
jgi:sulfate/thiosulfate transport system substrate-binding protein